MGTIMTLDSLLQKIKTQTHFLKFQEVIDVINEYYLYTPTHFTNGVGEKKQDNPAGTNEGSCKIFSFGKIHQLSEEQVLGCFGRYYREDVLQNPDGDDHGNIRAFIESGWAELSFDHPALKER